MDHIEQALTAQLYRITCPSSEELGEYHLHMLPAEQTTAVAQHLRTCPHCTRELAELKRDQIHAFGRDDLIEGCLGSMWATIEPAPEPRPGPTGISLSFAH